jgi:hypothetical protein
LIAIGCFAARVVCAIADAPSSTRATSPACTIAASWSPSTRNSAVTFDWGLEVDDLTGRPAPRDPHRAPRLVDVRTSASFLVMKNGERVEEPGDPTAAAHEQDRLELLVAALIA